MTARDICKHLIVEGWTEFPSQFHHPARGFYKRFDTPTRCSSNYDKPGQQVCIYVWDNPERPASYEIELVAGLPDGTWIILKQYVLPDDIRDGLKLIPRLLSVWEHAANQS